MITVLHRRPSDTATRAPRPAAVLGGRLVAVRLNPTAIGRAYQAHRDVYARLRAWEIPDHVRCWSRAWSAFERGSRTDFEWIYDELRRRWQVFRGPVDQHWSVDETLDRIRGLDRRFGALRLSAFSDEDLDGCWRVINAMSGIKRTKAPSVVAISKFLHFWNPRLFVIVDDAIMWRYVLARLWLRGQIEAERARVIALLEDASCPPTESACDLLSYLAVLVWASRVVRLNSEITPLFTEYVRASGGNEPVDFPIETYDAAAMEWLLLGLAEVPPAGVEMSGS